MRVMILWSVIKGSKRRCQDSCLIECIVNPMSPIEMAVSGTSGALSAFAASSPSKGSYTRLPSRSWYRQWLPRDRHYPTVI